MTETTEPVELRKGEAVSRFVLAGILTTIIDGTFSSILSVAFYGSTFSRLFQGVASTVLGPSAIDGGAGPTTIGVLMHCGVAFGWSAIFIFGLMRLGAIRRILASRYGAIKISVCYGPFVWTVMSLAVIPVLLKRPPAITFRWGVQLIGHFFFVGVPIVVSACKGMRLQHRR